MHVPLPLLMMICFFVVVIITAFTLVAIKWGYAYKHTVDKVMHDERGEDK